VSHNLTGAGYSFSLLVSGTLTTFSRPGGSGGGINNNDTAQIRNTIVAENNVSTGGTGPDVKGSFTSQGHNLIGTLGDSTGFDATCLTSQDKCDILGVPDPMLGPLQFNGGQTLTRELLPGSPAIDAGDDCVTEATRCGDLNLPQLTTDQRGAGFPRKVNTHVDIGAFELQSSLPDITCQADITVDNDQGQLSASVPFVVTATGVPQPTVECKVGTTVVTSPHTFPVGTTTVQCTATNGSGPDDSCSFTVTVNDTQKPLISCPDNKVVNTDAGSCSAIVNPGTASATDNDPALTVTGVRSDNQALNAPYPKGVTTITWTATDTANNSSSCEQTVTVNDAEKPTISAPADASYQCLSEVPAANAAQATASDHCGTPNVTVSETNNGGAGSPSSPLIITRTYTATDGSNNTQTATQTITVVDNTKPTVNAPAPASASADSSCRAMIPDVVAGSAASDNCGGAVTLAQSPVAGTPVGLGAHQITVTATDAAGNTNTATTTFTVNDTTRPTISLTGSPTMTVECHTSFTDPGATATDACAGSLPATASGSINVNAPGSYTITYNAADPSGNTALPVTRTVNVVDTTKPTLALNGAATMTVECHTAFVDPGATASDTCAGNLTGAIVKTGGVNPNAIGTYTLTYTVNDGRGNSNSITRTVNVVDTTKPTISCPSPVTVDATSASGAVVTLCSTVRLRLMLDCHSQLLQAVGRRLPNRHHHSPVHRHGRLAQHLFVRIHRDRGRSARHRVVCAEST
jgi:hypothetical protein